MKTFKVIGWARFGNGTITAIVEAKTFKDAVWKFHTEHELQNGRITVIGEKSKKEFDLSAV